MFAENNNINIACDWLSLDNPHTAQVVHSF